eukprot:gene7222-9853_t
MCRKFQLLLILLYTIISVYSAVNVSNQNSPIASNPQDEEYKAKPNINGAKTFYGGVIADWNGKVEVMTSPIVDTSTGSRTIIGTLAQMNKDTVLQVLESAKLAWSNGQGIWPQMSASKRIDALENVVVALKEHREDIIKALVWEICKSVEDASSEFDRTMIFIETTISEFRKLDEQNSVWKVVSGIVSRVRRAAIGIMLCLGPFNYPFNETYATLIPALLAGNIVIMKIPNTGGLAHVLTMEAYAKHLPPGTINFISGSGRETLAPMMATGDIDVLAFIGGSKAADIIIKAHPHPHRLKIFLQLEGKNLGIILPDADIDTTVEQVTIGSTSYNGQRCTAIKLVMIHKSIVDEFLPKFITSISSLKWGAPWVKGVQITPVPEVNKPRYLQDLIEDAISKGASVINAKEELGNGGELFGALMRPAIVYPVTSSMRLWDEEQFGPVIPIAVYENITEVYDYYKKTVFGQQAAIFTSHADSSSDLLDILSTAVGRININTQCGRSPDVLPFSGRRSSALGTMSVTEAFNSFSIETLVAAKYNSKNEAILKDFENHSKFLAPLNNLTVTNDEL